MGICTTCKIINLPCNSGEYPDSTATSNPNPPTSNYPGKNISTSTTTNNKESNTQMNKSLSQENVNSTSKNDPNHQTNSNISNPFSKFEVLMLNEINSVRLTPKNYSVKLKNLIPMIKGSTANNKIFLIYDDDVKIELKKGVTAFKSCIEYLNNRNNIALEPIEFVEDLVIPFPHHNSKLCLDKNYISKCIDDIREKIKNKYEIFDFQYDISPNPVLSTIIQVVDDTNANFQRRNNILSESVKYVGISYGEVKKGIYCFYLLFAC